MKSFQIPWEELEAVYPASLIDAVRAMFDRDGSFATSSSELASSIPESEALAERLLKALSPPLQMRVAVLCANCGNELDTNEDGKACPKCNAALREPGGTADKLIFELYAPRTRDIRWVLALHGMNTHGSWQEEFNWRIATAYGRSVPVAIYKYGIVRPGALSRWYQQRLVRDVTVRLMRLRGAADNEGFGGLPDVIAHSLGTWLIGHALIQNPSLKIGRLVLTGSILRPDFDWSRLISTGQVEAVLNHYGTKDLWAAVAHYGIPDSGPSGRTGFLDSGSAIVQVRADGLAHSDFFTDAHLPWVFENVWKPFLTAAQCDLPEQSSHDRQPWSQAYWPIRATLLPAILIAIWWLSALFALCCLLLGISTAFRVL